MTYNHVGIVTPDTETIPMFQYVLRKLNTYNVAFVHIAGPTQDLTGTPVAVLQDDYFSHFRHHYNGRLMANLGFTQQSGNMILKEGKADLESFGQLFIPNPDLAERFKYQLPLSKPHLDTYYTGEKKDLLIIRELRIVALTRYQIKPIPFNNLYDRTMLSTKCRKALSRNVLTIPDISIYDLRFNLTTIQNRMSVRIHLNGSGSLITEA